MKRVHFHYGIILLIMFIGISCTKDKDSSIYKYNPPEDYSDGLEVSTLNSVGLNTGSMEFMVDDINSNKYGVIHSVLIIKDGKLVFEEYFNGFDKDYLHDLASVSKSICSALIGIALENQFINSADDPIQTYLPEYTDIDWSEKGNITLHHLLTMSSGLSWDEWTTRYDDPDNLFVNMEKSPDPVEFVLNRPLIHEPGTFFTYNTGLPLVLGKIISNAANMNLDTFAIHYLFEPLGIGEHHWYIYGNNTYSIGSGLKLTSRDMAKFGLLYLNKGVWNGEQIVTEEWIIQSTNSYFSPWYGTSYGYYWWKIPLFLNGRQIDEYSAHGRGGQFIFILPAYDMVVVFTSWNDNDLINRPVNIMQDYILPAISL
jgi:CubicO group peptidase (beta-lactamase class C family)